MAKTDRGRMKKYIYEKRGVVWNNFRGIFEPCSYIKITYFSTIKLQFKFFKYLKVILDVKKVKNRQKKIVRYLVSQKIRRSTSQESQKSREYARGYAS